MRWVRLIVGLPLLAILISFALSNRAPITLGLWPTDVTIELPASVAILGAAAITFLLGGLVVWVTELQQRHRARRAEHAVKLLEDQVRMLQARLPAQDVLPPAA